MIKSANGKKIPASKKAKEIIKSLLNTDFDYYQQRQCREENMTDKEWALIQQSMGELFFKINRILK